jgi:hypothetical protein
LRSGAKPGRFLGRESSTYTTHLLRTIGDNVAQEPTTMNLKRSHRQSVRRLEFLDTLMDSYMNWRDHSREVDESYRSWVASTASDRGIAYARYLAALDREAHAAHGYKHALDRAQPT